MSIYLIRHGQSVQNTMEAKLIDPKVNLTEEGKKQSMEAGEFLSNYLISEQEYSKNSCMWVSSYTRAIETANYLNYFLNVNSLNYDSSLIEQDYGIYSNMTVKERREKYPDMFELEDAYYNSGRSYFLRKPCGESPLDVKVRTERILEKVINSEYDNKFIVSHGVAIKTLVLNYLQYCDTLKELDYEWYENNPIIPNTGIIKLNNGEFDYIYNKPIEKVLKR